MNPSTLKAMVYILEISSKNDGVSLKRLLTHRHGVRKTDIIRAWNLFLRLKVLKLPEEGGDQDYRLIGFSERTVADFLTIWMRKIARVSPVGHRSVRVAAQDMALHDGVMSKACGSIIWKEKVPMPKFRLPHVRVLDLLHGKKQMRQFTVEETKPTHMQFRLDFQPPLSAGKIVEYGFYIWNRNYYSRSRKEALQLYKDEWIREGLAVTGPAFDVKIMVRLPEGYRYQDFRLEKGTAPSAGGPASLGEILPGLQHRERTLSVSLQ